MSLQFYLVIIPKQVLLVLDGRYLLLLCLLSVADSHHLHEIETETKYY